MAILKRLTLKVKLDYDGNVQLKIIERMSKTILQSYDPLEEKINAYSHALGALLALIAGILMLIKGIDLPIGQFFGLCVYAFSMVLLFSSSAIYHFSTEN